MLRVLHPTSKVAPHIYFRGTCCKVQKFFVVALPVALHLGIVLMILPVVAHDMGGGIAVVHNMRHME